MSIWNLLFGVRIKRGRMNYETLKMVENKWPQIETTLRIGKPSNLKEAVIEADKLTDFVLRTYYPDSETMGERLKLAREKFLNNKIAYDDLWYAHKIRNEIVHNTAFNLPSFEVESLITKFKTGLQILGAMR